MDKTFYNSLFKQEVAAAPSYGHIFFLTALLQEAFIRNIIIIARINYIIIICINDNNIVIMNNSYGRLQDLILHFKIPKGTRKNFLETCGQFGPRLANGSPTLVYSKVLPRTVHEGPEREYRYSSTLSLT
jgi:hypothetical protein